jgi:hypothetical protein
VNNRSSSSSSCERSSHARDVCCKCAAISLHTFAHVCGSLAETQYAFFLLWVTAQQWSLCCHFFWPCLLWSSVARHCVSYAVGGQLCQLPVAGCRNLAPQMRGGAEGQWGSQSTRAAESPVSAGQWLTGVGCLVWAVGCQCVSRLLLGVENGLCRCVAALRA